MTRSLPTCAWRVRMPLTSNLQPRPGHAHLDEFIQSLPQGYGTVIGEEGARLSGGQAQRLALARAFLKNAPILILDEPTSSLDPEQEMLVESALHDLMHGRTVITIAHRLNTVFQADRIFVLEQGRLVEEGYASTNCWRTAGSIPGW